jgi:hypothetical protein
MDAILVCHIGFNNLEPITYHINYKYNQLGQNTLKGIGNIILY